MRRTSIFAAALALMATMFTSIPAAASVSPFCMEHGYCVFSASDFKGQKVAIPLNFGCHTVAEIGLSTVQSAARGFGDSYVLELHSNGSCTAYIDTVVFETPRASAKSYKLIQIPARI